MTDQISATLAGTTIGRRYIVRDLIGSGGMGSVYSADDRLTGDTVALKRVTVNSEIMPFMSEVAPRDLNLSIVQEFRVLSSLRHPNIISVYDYGFDDERVPFFTMEFLRDVQPITDATRGQTVEQKANMIIALLQALTYLHRRGILHCDLKPGNIVVANDRLRVLDFGLAKPLKQGGKESGTSGTLGYIAPEVLQSQDYSEAADLYSVGVILYELLTGVWLYNGYTLSRMIDAILYEIPDLSDPAIDERLRPILTRLLAKNPQDRYRSAPELIHEISQALGLPEAAESEAIRESFLQSSNLVGRDRELATLSEQLEKALNREGSGILVGGESGVGKSRLLDEIRALAMVKGALLLRGQSVSDGGSPYEVWRLTLRWLTLLTDPDDLEAGVLKNLIPDISTLLKRPVPDAPVLDPRASHERTLSIIAGLFRRLQNPLVLLLEDLHWSGAESIALLARLLDISHDLPILIVGSFRDDEMPDLPARLPQMQNMRLQRLPASVIGELSSLMLGTTAPQPTLVNWLERETEGNVYFLIEALRALAEESGGLQQVVGATLPLHITSGGIQRIVERRLDKVPAEHRALLQMTAIAGRLVDPEMLKHLAPDTSIERWLEICANAVVLEVHEAEWRFAHDKLRETLLQQTPPDVQKQLHGKVAAAIEAAYPGDPHQAGRLAYHWAQAGDLQKEAHYAQITGDQLLRAGAYANAAEYLNRASDLSANNPQWPMDRAMLERSLGETYRALGQLTQYVSHYEKALDSWHLTFPRSVPSIMGNMLIQLGQQTLYRFIPGTIPSRTPAEIHKLENASHVYYQLAEAYYHKNNSIASLYGGLRGLNLAEQTGQSPARAVAYATMAIVTGTTRMHGLARFYRDLAWKLARKLNDAGTIAYIGMTTNVFNAGAGEWDRIRGELAEAIRICEQRGDWRLKGMSQDIVAEIDYYEGNFDASYNTFEELLQVAQRSHDVQIETWGFLGKAKNLARAGEFDAALDLIKQAEKAADPDDLVSRIRMKGELAEIYIRTGQIEQAQQAADEALKLTSIQPIPNALEMRVGFAAPAEVYVTLLQAEPDNTRYMKQARKALQKMGIFSFFFKAGIPILARWQGALAWQTGKPDAAHKAWTRSIEAARSLKMPYEEALTYYEMLSRVPSSDPQVVDYRQKAQALFEKLGAKYHLARLEENRA